MPHKVALSYKNPQRYIIFISPSNAYNLIYYTDGRKYPLRVFLSNPKYFYNRKNDHSLTFTIQVHPLLFPYKKNVSFLCLYDDDPDETFTPIFCINIDSTTCAITLVHTGTYLNPPYNILETNNRKIDITFLYNINTC